MPNQSLDDALLYLNHRNYTNAKPILESLIRDQSLEKSTRAHAYEALGEIYEHEKNLTFALICYDKAVSLAKNKLSPWHRLGASYTAWAVNLMACHYPAEQVSVLFTMGKNILSQVIERAPHHPPYLQSMIDWCEQYIHFIDTLAPSCLLAEKRAETVEILEATRDTQENLAFV